MNERWEAQPEVDCGNCVNGAYCIDDAACDIFERRISMDEKVDLNRGHEVVSVPVVAYAVPSGENGGNCDVHCDHLGTVTHEDGVLGHCRLFRQTLAVINWGSRSEVHRCHACFESEKLAKTVVRHPLSATKIKESTMSEETMVGRGVPKFGDYVWFIPEDYDPEPTDVQRGIVISHGTRSLKCVGGGFVPCVMLSVAVHGRVPQPFYEVPAEEAFATLADLATHYDARASNREAVASRYTAEWGKFLREALDKNVPMGEQRAGVQWDEGKVSVIESKDGKFTAQWGGAPHPMHCGCLMVDSDGPNTPLRVSCCHPDVLRAEQTSQEAMSKSLYAGACRESENIMEERRVDASRKEEIDEQVKVLPTPEDEEESRAQQRAYQEAVKQDWRNMTTADLMLAYRRVLCDVTSALGLVFEENVSPQGRCDLIVEAIRENRHVVDVVGASPKE